MTEIRKIDIVKNYIYKEIKSGRLSLGQRLPSCRHAADILQVNKITVNKAYSELEDGHIVYSVPKGGYYLVKSDPTSKSKIGVVDFSTVKPDGKLIPYREFVHSINRAVDIYKKSLFENDLSPSILPLRETLRRKFEQDGIYTSEDRIIITNGAQQAISLTLQALYANSKKKLLVEVPTYRLVLKLAEHLGIEVAGIYRYDGGYDFKKLEQLFKKEDILAFYIIPRHHNPTGFSLSEKDKIRAAELANNYGVTIIEDDYLGDLGSRKRALPIHYYDISKMTIYIRSFSETFIPGIRLGAAVIPESIKENITQVKYISDLNTSKLNQAALDVFIKSGMYDKHIKKIKRCYEAKLKKAAEILSNCSIEGVKWHVPEHGIFIWLELPKHINVDILQNNLEKEGILIKNAYDFFINGFSDKDMQYMRLCISGVDIKNISSISKIVRKIASMDS